MNCLVTGATGFTGGHLARALLAKGCKVRALVRQTSNTKELYELGIECALGDIRDAGAVDRAVQGMDVIYHIAALYRQEGLPERVYRDVNVQGTKHILEAAKKYTSVRRVVYCSTVGVHGDVQSPPANEETEFRPGDIYQSTKLEAEKLARAAFSNGVVGSIFRPTGIYGPGDRRFLKLFRAVKSRQFRMFGPGTARYHMTYIDDLVEGILTLGERPQALGRTFILGGNEVPTLNELVRAVAKAVDVRAPNGRLPLWPLKAAAHVCSWVYRPLGIEPPLYPRRVDFFHKERSFDISKAKRLLKFQPKTDLATGLRLTAQWYKEKGWL